MKAFLWIILLISSYSKSQANEQNSFYQVATTWTNGDMNQFYLDFAHTQKTFDDLQLAVGTYSYTVQTNKRNNQPGRVNFDITVLYQNGANDKKVDKQFAPGTTQSGTFTIEDYKSQSGGTPAGYGQIKVHIGRADHNTNVNYQIVITRQNNIPVVPAGSGGKGSGNVNLSQINNSDNCNYSDLGSKNGNVLGNTVGNYTSDKKACKSNASVVVNKTDGSARTTVLVYASDDSTGQGTLIASDEFPNGQETGSKTIPLTGVKNKFIKVELKNRSATNQFKYSLNINQ